MISLILPFRGEAPAIVEKFIPFAREMEIVVAGAGVSPETVAAFEAIGARILDLPGRTRGFRLDAAARAARGDILFFLHADSRPPAGAAQMIAEAVAGGTDAGCFHLAYEPTSPGLAWIAFWANLRTRLLRLPFGDQGIFCTREMYNRTGGFRDLPICDDVDFVQRLRQVHHFRVLEPACTTSPRRYEKRKVARVLRNWKVLAGYFAGVNPRTLERWYRR